ncbi:MAG TPA: hypothetical protein VGN85_00080 [Methyloceanibacter sp.]|nr:hypothetical protein [Methyloceanibacter sp.]
MRSINLLKVAAEAEILRLRALLARQGKRAAFGAVAVIFMLGVLVLVEVAGWQVLCPMWRRFPRHSFCSALTS